MKIAIVDDDKNQLKLLSDKVNSYLEKLPSPFQIITYPSGTELLKASRPFDLIFLDIQMQELSGMETAKKLRLAGNSSYIVFVTVLQEYVYDAFEVEASDYLLKPVDDKRFERMMNRICSSLQKRNKSSLIITSKGNTCKSVSLQDILYCEAVNHKINIHTKTGIQECYFKIEELERQLDDRFFRCHRSYLVNLDYVCGYQDRLALLDNGAGIPVSRLRGHEFSLNMLQHMKKKGE